MEPVLAIVLGLAFGFVLHRISASDPQVIIDMLRLRDLRLMKSILFAIGLGSGLLFVGLAAGLIDPGHLSVKASNVGVLLGGLLLGAGWAVSGFCPGTGVVAMGDGRRDAVAFVIGGLAGAGAYMAAYPAALSMGLLDDIAGGKATLAETGEYAAAIGAPGWLVALALAAVFMLIAAILPKTLPGGRSHGGEARRMGTRDAHAR